MTRGRAAASTGSDELAVRLPLSYGNSARWWLNVTCAGLAVAVGHLVLRHGAVYQADLPLAADGGGKPADREHEREPERRVDVHQHVKNAARGPRIEGFRGILGEH